MIIKDESHVIEQTLSHLITKFRFDFWVICDTGSSDNTPQIVCDFFAKAGIPGELHSHPWVDFGHNRSRALEAAYDKTDYVFIFDADDELCGTPILPDPLDLDGYHMSFGGGFCYRRLALLNNRKKWKYVGVLHEVLFPQEDIGATGDLQGDYHCVSGKTGARSKDPNKYHKDAAVLEKAYLEQENLAPWLRQRYAFYCGQSYKDAKEWDKSIEWYKRRIGLGGWDQELYVSHTYVGDMLSGNGDSAGALRHWLAACELGTGRCETLSRAAKFYEVHDQAFVTKLLYDQVDVRNVEPRSEYLFMDEGLHSYRLLCEMVLFYASRKDHSRTIEVLDTLLRRYETIGLEWLAPTLHNVWFLSLNTEVPVEFPLLAMDLADRIVRCGVGYAELPTVFAHFADKVRAGAEVHQNDAISLRGSVPLLITITSCKRLNLLIKTLNSLRWACEDLDAAVDIVCVDDNSCKDDRATMRCLYPWVRFIMKGEEDKGHRASMEIIREELTRTGAKYWMQLEDDWTFIRRDRYLTRSIEYLERHRDKGVHQVLFNKGYAEISEDISWTCGEQLEPGLLLHVHGHPDHPCGYWPHFSFRPSVISVETIDKLGSFESPNTFFEKDYADRYVSAGFKSAYMDRISCLHTGSLAGARSSGANAYSLNGVRQGIESTTPALDLPMKVINLERRPDRLETMRQRLDGHIHYDVVKAVDGLALKSDDPRLRMFHGNDYGNNAGTIGCALTHIELWEELLEDDTTDYYIVVEDDCQFAPGWPTCLSEITEEMAREDMIMLGYHTFASHAENLRRRCNDLCVSGKQAIVDLDRGPYIGGFFCYSISKSGAAKAMDIVREVGVVHGIDYLVVKTPKAEILTIRELLPAIGFSYWNEGGREIDTDIQNQCVPIHISVPKRTRIGILTNWCSSEEACVEFGRMGKTLGIWNDLELVSSPPYDYLLVINHPIEPLTFDPRRTIVMQMEPWCEGQTWGVNTWGEWAVPDTDKYMCVIGRKTATYNNVLSQLEQNYADLLETPEKTKCLSSICSNKYFDPGHIKRVDFLKYIDSLGGPVSIDVYSQDNPVGFLNYAGPVSPFVDKSKGIMPYKYYFMAENNFEPGFITEKLWEPIICECLVFYQGAPDVAKYVNPEAFVQLDLDDFEGSYEIMKKAIEENWWDKRLPAIRAMKQKILNEMNMFPRLENIIRSKGKLSA
jgi:GR25 family glycosyltransferase involved in LPS biosynthesis/glycosyltransferase involved in cell wall biosynthesis/GT2 family glycosyltransferase